MTLVADVGDVVRLYTSEPFTDTETAVATDPGAVTLIVEKPDATQLVYGWPSAGANGALTRNGAGDFEVYVAVDQAGPWQIRWASTGTATAAEASRIFVRRPNVALA